MHLDDGDDRQSSISRLRDKEGGSNHHYPDINSRQYVHKNPHQLVSSQDSLVNQPRNSG